MQLTDAQIKVFREIKGSMETKYIWYRVGTRDEQARGHYIYPDIILNDSEHQQRLNCENLYGTKKA